MWKPLIGDQYSRLVLDHRNIIVIFILATQVNESSVSKEDWTLLVSNVTKNIRAFFIFDEGI